MFNPFQSALKYIANKFTKEMSKMLIWTGAISWVLSSAAQISAIVKNPKIKDEQKGFLIPQEMFDAGINILTFLVITCSAKKLTSKLFSTGKFAPKEVRSYLNKHSNIFKDKIGKVDFNIDDFFKDNPSMKKNFPLDKYYTYKNAYTTIATLCAGIVSSNIITPIIRNKKASKAQKNYIQLSAELSVPKPDVQNPHQPNSINLQKRIISAYNSGNMKI